VKKEGGKLARKRNGRNIGSEGSRSKREEGKREHLLCNLPVELM